MTISIPSNRRWFVWREREIWGCGSWGMEGWINMQSVPRGLQFRTLINVDFSEYDTIRHYVACRLHGLHSCLGYC